LSVTKTKNRTVIYCVSEPDREQPVNEFFQVSFQGDEVNFIRLPAWQVDGRDLSARMLWMLKLLLSQLESEGHPLSYRIADKIK